MSLRPFRYLLGSHRAEILGKGQSWINSEMFPEGDAAGCFALSFLLFSQCNEHKAEAHLLGGERIRAPCEVIAEWLLFTEQDCRALQVEVLQLLIPPGQLQVQLTNQEVEI